MKSLKINSLLIGIFLFASLAHGADNKIRNSSTPIEGMTGGTMSANVEDVSKYPELNHPTENKSNGSEPEASIEGPHTNNLSTGRRCANGDPNRDSLPNGWTIIYANNVSTCAPPYTSGYYSINYHGLYYWDQYEYASYYDIPVGGTLQYCAFIGTPAGWQVIQSGIYGSCSGAGTDSVMQHVSCVAGDTNCYPTSAAIYASPTNVVVPYALTIGSSTISWSTTGYGASPCVWVQNNGTGSPQLWGCSGATGSSVSTFVPSNGYTQLWLAPSSSSSSPVLASVTVHGTAGTAPTITASPTVVTIPAGQTVGSTTISYNLTGSGYNSTCLWVQNTGGQPTVWGCNVGLTHSQVWTYVPKGGTSRIWLAYSQTVSTPVLATVTITGQ